MRVLRDRREDPAADRERTRSMVDGVAETGEPAVRVWRPPRQVAFGRRDATTEGYDRARAAASQRGYPPIERAVGGRAVAFTGETVAFALAEPVADERRRIRVRYDRVQSAVRETLRERGLAVAPGEPPDSFCPGSHSLRTPGGKLAGFAQRVRSRVALVAGLVVDDAERVAAALAPVYGALDVPFDPTAVGDAAGPDEGAVAAASLPDALAAALGEAARDGTPSSAVRDT